MPTSPPCSARRRTALVVALFALGIVLRAPAFLRPLLSDDEAIYAVTGDAVARGALLYRDVVDHKPPLIYHLYQAGFALCGPYNTQGVHAAVVLAVLLTAGFLMAARAAGKEKTIGGAMAGGAMFLIFSTTWHDYDALAANCELFLLAPQAMAAWLLVRDRATNRVMRHFAIGCLIGLAALCKYQGLTLLGASVGVLLWELLLGQCSRGQVALLAACQIAGAGLPAALYLAACALAGNAEAALYWFRFNFSYVKAGLGGTAALVRGLYRTAMIGGTAFVPYALGCSAGAQVAAGLVRTVHARLLGRSGSDCPSRASIVGLFWLIASVLALVPGGRFFGHYFHLTLAPLCLLAGPGFAALWRRGKRVRAGLLLMTAAPALIFFALASFARPLAMALDEGEGEPPYPAVAARLSALTAPDERIFVWGNSPQLYVLARRPMGARFSFCNYMTGESPGTPTETGQWNADRYQLGAAWDMLFADLESRRPPILVDAAAAGWDGYAKFPIKRYPRLQSYVDQHYRARETVSGVVLYQRER